MPQSKPRRRFQKRHYKEIAGVLNSYNPETYPLSNEVWEALKADFERVFAADNPGFDPAKFDKACNRAAGTA
jgi:hypothetical protein